MSRSEHVLYHLVLAAIADDYESFEDVLKHVMSWAAEDGTGANREAVIEVLASTICEGDAQAYVLSSQAPHSQPVEFSLERLHDLWFYVTPKGKRVAEQS